ncbi:MAG TPA: hypothetical protein VKZ85_06275 [Woeseiaceae bacterium]|nr:hypothetical protein [Woeseiaceae bacterium]
MTIVQHTTRTLDDSSSAFLPATGRYRGTRESRFYVSDSARFFDTPERRVEALSSWRATAGRLLHEHEHEPASTFPATPM